MGSIFGMAGIEISIPVPRKVVKLSLIFCSRSISLRTDGTFEVVFVFVFETVRFKEEFLETVPDLIEFNDEDCDKLEDNNDEIPPSWLSFEESLVVDFVLVAFVALGGVDLRLDLVYVLVVPVPLFRRELLSIRSFSLK
jgi:hypothetical protein